MYAHELKEPWETQQCRGQSAEWGTQTCVGTSPSSASKHNLYRKRDTMQLIINSPPSNAAVPCWLRLYDTQSIVSPNYNRLTKGNDRLFSWLSFQWIDLDPSLSACWRRIISAFRHVWVPRAGRTHVPEALPSREGETPKHWNELYLDIHQTCRCKPGITSALTVHACWTCRTQSCCKL